jgi:hypothetical protein
MIQRAWVISGGAGGSCRFRRVLQVHAAPPASHLEQQPQRKACTRQSGQQAAPLCGRRRHTGWHEPLRGR